MAIFLAPYDSPKPRCASHSGLGSSRFARRYSGNRFFFLFLRLLRCFSSPGAPRMTMDSSYGGWDLPSRVSPFRYPWIAGCLRLPTAFRSLPRLSSALSAKASALCSFLLSQYSSCIALHESGCRPFLFPYSLWSAFLDVKRSFPIFGFQGAMGLSGLEPPTSRLSGVRSNRLSYKPALAFMEPPLGKYPSKKLLSQKL